MTKQEEIKSLLTTFGIKQSWLAEKLGMKNQTLSYLINESKKFDEELYEKCKHLINEYQFEFKFIRDGEDNLDLFEGEDFYKGFGERLRHFAKLKFGTLKNLAAAMRISPQQLQQYISGKREPGSRILNRLLRLGCDINWLLGGIESLESFKIHNLEKELSNLKLSISQISSLIQRIEGRDYFK